MELITKVGNVATNWVPRSYCPCLLGTCEFIPSTEGSSKRPYPEYPTGRKEEVYITNKIPSAKHSVHTRHVQEENEETSLQRHTSKHVFIEGRVGQRNLNKGEGTLRDLQAKTLDHCTITMVTKYPDWA